MLAVRSNLNLHRQLQRVQRVHRAHAQARRLHPMLRARRAARLRTAPFAHPAHRVVRHRRLQTLHARRVVH